MHRPPVRDAGSLRTWEAPGQNPHPLRCPSDLLLHRRPDRPRFWPCLTASVPRYTSCHRFRDAYHGLIQQPASVLAGKGRESRPVPHMRPISAEAGISRRSAVLPFISALGRTSYQSRVLTGRLVAGRGHLHLIMHHQLARPPGQCSSQKRRRCGLNAEGYAAELTSALGIEGKAAGQTRRNLSQKTSRANMQETGGSKPATPALGWKRKLGTNSIRQYRGRDGLRPTPPWPLGWSHCRLCTTARSPTHQSHWVVGD